MVTRSFLWRTVNGGIGLSYASHAQINNPVPSEEHHVSRNMERLQAMPTPHLPPNVTAISLLAANGVGMSGFRLGKDLDRKLVAVQVQVVRRSEAAMTFLRERQGPDVAAEVRIKKRVMERHQTPRRPNPTKKQALDLDESILDLMMHAVAVENASSNLIVRREALGAFFNVPDHFVSQSLERLNKRGLVGPESNQPAHDSNRYQNLWGGSSSGWAASHRYASIDKLKELAETIYRVAAPVRKPRP